jgi:hypothetical protein
LQSIYASLHSQPCQPVSITELLAGHHKDNCWLPVAAHLAALLLLLLLLLLFIEPQSSCRRLWI